MSSPPTQLDPSSFEALVRRDRAALQRLARRLTGDRDEAEDLLQESLLDAYRSFSRFRPGSHFYGWVGRIMRNNHLDRVRRKRCPTVPLDAGPAAGDGEGLDLPDEAADPERLLLQDELDHPFQSALEALQPAHRETVLLCDLQGATYEEAAAASDCPVGTIRSRLHRAHKLLRQFLDQVVPAFQPEPPAPLPVHTRRAFLRMGTAAVAGAALHGLGSEAEARCGRTALRVRIWSPDMAAGGGMAQVIEGPNTEVTVASGAQGIQQLADEALAGTDVLILSGETAGTVPQATARAIARRVRHEGMGLIIAAPGPESTVLEALLETPSLWEQRPGQESAVELHVTAPRHPIARGVDAFRIESAAEYAGFAGPQPEIVLFDGVYPSSGARAWQGMAWTLGEGRLFYFQPPCASSVLPEPVRRVFRNAVEWCAGRKDVLSRA